MATTEQNVLIRAKDAQGNSSIIYPITKAENVDGLEEMIVQPDWSQNDETQADYVKNRTHYCDISEVTAFDGVGTYDANGSVDPYVVYVFDSTPDLNSELTYKVYLNGEPYNREFHYFEDFGVFLALDDEQNTPVASLESDAMVFTDLTYSTLGDSPTIKICITIEDPHPLDEKYIPDTIARTDALTELRTEVYDSIQPALDKKSAVQFNSNFLSTLNIHKLSQEEYDQAVADGTIDENALYLTPDSAVQFIIWEEGD